MEAYREKKKLLFFDIDGTLIPFGGQIPESAKYALQRAKAEGNLLFLCSGRSQCSIPQSLLELGFDGIVSATGAAIRFRGEVVRSQSLGQRIHKLVEVLEECRAAYTIQTPGENFSPLWAAPWIQSHKLQEYNIRLENIQANPDKYSHAEKAVVYYTPVPYPELEKRLGPEFEVTGSSLEPTDLSGCEITMAGVNKSSAMQWLGEYLGVDREDMIAFGDGPNDVDMLTFAGTAVAMGNAVAQTKAVADHITAPAAEDGIYQAMKELFRW